MGKSTLLQAIHEKHPHLQVHREGDYSPVDLAWCTWMSENEYLKTLSRYRSLENEIKENTFREQNRYIITYTKILTDIPGFHKDLEQYEIYNGRKTVSEFKEIILSRYARFAGDGCPGCLFECAFLQNILEDFILFHQLKDDEIMEFYYKLYALIQKENFLLLYLNSDRIEDTTDFIRRERSDEQGCECWYSMMIKYLADSPYGKKHGCHDFGDLISHFRHRQSLELRIIREIIHPQACILPAKQWDISDLISL